MLQTDVPDEVVDPSMAIERAAKEAHSMRASEKARIPIVDADLAEEQRAAAAASMRATETNVEEEVKEPVAGEQTRFPTVNIDLEPDDMDFGDEEF